jgi:hypothetical protein
VHNVGELQMHIGNWGMFGSWPGSNLPFSQSPSAQWPAGSGVEYLVHRRSCGSVRSRPVCRPFQRRHTSGNSARPRTRVTSCTARLKARAAATASRRRRPMMIVTARSTRLAQRVRR